MKGVTFQDVQLFKEVWLLLVVLCYQASSYPSTTTAELKFLPLLGTSLQAPTLLPEDLEKSTGQSGASI